MQFLRKNIYYNPLVSCKSRSSGIGNLQDDMCGIGLLHLSFRVNLQGHFS